MTPLPLTDGAFFVSNSFLEWVQICSRGSEFYKLAGRTKAEFSPAPTFGSHIHSALEMHYRLQEFNLSRDEITSRVATLLQSEFQREPIDESDFRNLNWAMEIYQQYIAKYEFEEMGLMRYGEPQKCKYCEGKGIKFVSLKVFSDIDSVPFDDGPCPWCNGTGSHTIMTEVPFVVKLFDYNYGPVLPIYYHGFIDLPVTLNNHLYTLDFKSTSLLGNGFWDDKQASAQQKGYVYGFQETTGLSVHGYIVRAIRVNQPPVYVTNGTANKKGEFKKISDWWAESFMEQTYLIHEGELEEWKANAISLVEEFFWHYSRGYFPHRRTACSGKFGRCQYWDVCTTYPPKDRSLVLESGLFKNKENKTPNIK